MSAEDAQAILQPLADAYERYEASSLNPIYARAKRALDDWRKDAANRSRSLVSELDRRFGPLENICATELGNLVEAQNHYAAKRYKMEAEIFWPRLQAVIPEAFLPILQEPRILLDFALTMASMFGFCAAAAVFGGPWLWYKPGLWVTVSAVAAGGALLFYRLAVGAAAQLTELTRASFDLYRLKLMEALGRPRPLKFSQEMRQWEELSSLAMYGVVDDFDLRPEATS